MRSLTLKASPTGSSRLHRSNHIGQGQANKVQPQKQMHRTGRVKRTKYGQNGGGVQKKEKGIWEEGDGELTNEQRNLGGESRKCKEQRETKPGTLLECSGDKYGDSSGRSNKKNKSTGKDCKGMREKNSRTYREMSAPQ